MAGKKGSRDILLRLYEYFRGNSSSSYRFDIEINPGEKKIVLKPRPEDYDEDSLSLVADDFLKYFIIMGGRGKKIVLKKGGVSGENSEISVCGADSFEMDEDLFFESMKAVADFYSTPEIREAEKIFEADPSLVFFTYYRKGLEEKDDLASVPVNAFERHVPSYVLRDGLRKIHTGEKSSVAKGREKYFNDIAKGVCKSPFFKGVAYKNKVMDSFYGKPLDVYISKGKDSQNKEGDAFVAVVMASEPSKQKNDAKRTKKAG